MCSISANIQKKLKIPENSATLTFSVKVDARKNDGPVIVIRNQAVADFFELGDMTSVFRLHKGLQIDVEKACADEKDRPVVKTPKPVTRTNETLIGK